MELKGWRVLSLIVLHSFLGSQFHDDHSKSRDRADPRNDCQRILEDCKFQALQFWSSRNSASARSPPSLAKGSRRISPDLSRNGILWNAHQQLHRKFLLELRRAFPTPTTSGPRCSRYLFHQWPSRSLRFSLGLSWKGEHLLKGFNILSRYT